MHGMLKRSSVLYRQYGEWMIRETNPKAVEALEQMGLPMAVKAGIPAHYGPDDAIDIAKRNFRMVGVPEGMVTVRIGMPGEENNQPVTWED